MEGPHTHWENYHVRVVPQEAVMTTKGNHLEPEKLQLICIDDGIIFHEVEIKREE